MSKLVVRPAELKRAYDALRPTVDERVLDVISSGNYILGENVKALEEAVAAYVGTRYAVAVNSGTDALHLGLRAAGIGPGDEVITTPYTFAATLEAIEYCGATPVLVDIDPATFNIDPAAVESALGERTRGLLPVHMFGLPAAMEPIMQIAAQHDLAVIEDCAQSLGAHIEGKATGSFGAAGAFSFYPSKTLGCCGDGGMIATNDDAVYERLQQLRNHGNDGKGEHVVLGYNSRLDEVQAVILRMKLPLLDAMNQRRREIARYYNDALANTSATVPVAPDDRHHHVYGYYTLCTDRRDAVRAGLQEAGIVTMVYYAKPLHRQTHFSRSCRFGDLPQADHVSTRCLSLPIFPEMTDAEIEHVAATAARLIG